MSGHKPWAEIRHEHSSDRTPEPDPPIPPLTPFYAAWWYLHDHLMFRDEIGASRFATEMWVHVARVNPETDSVDDDDTKNTKVEIWLEAGPYEAEYGQCSHDYPLDCGGGTYEKAIIALAANVRARYGDSGEKPPQE